DTTREGYRPAYLRSLRRIIFFTLQATPAPSSTLFPYTTLFRSQLQQPIQQGFGPGRTAGHVDVYGDDLVHPLDDTIAIVVIPRSSAGPHRDDVSRLRHLVVDPADHFRHLPGDRAGDDHEVSLPGRCAEHARAEAIDIVA